MRIQIEVSDLPGREDFIVAKDHTFTRDGALRYPGVDRLDIVSNLAEVVSGTFDAICGELQVSISDRNTLVDFLTKTIRSNNYAVMFESARKATSEPS